VSRLRARPTPALAQAQAKAKARQGEGLFAAAVGLWVALTLLKFGNPIILDHQISAPTSVAEALIVSWPVAWGYGLTTLLAAAGCIWWRRKELPSIPTALLWAPTAWLAWQCVSATQSVDGPLTAASLKQFAACVAAFYFGVLVLSGLARLRVFWLAVLGGFLVLMVIGWQQHWGGFEETRRYFYSLPDWRTYPPEFIKRLASDRIYATLFYPNALAGVILLWLPISMAVIWDATRGEAQKLRWAGMAGMASFAVLALGCLAWSGSKAGWLILLGEGLAAVLILRTPAWVKWGTVIGLLVLGLTGFWLRYHGYFSKGATSVSARFDYWEVAGRTLLSKPILGSGPGTFATIYGAQKRPEAEMARLAHNDYLQQGSDSGVLGLVLYASWLIGGLVMIYRRGSVRTDVISLGIWLGLAGLAGQGLVEFWLYVPALAWPAFLLLGWRLAQSAASGNGIDKQDGHP
jgi:hypothetical protein